MQDGWTSESRETLRVKLRPMPANVSERTTSYEAGTQVGWHWPAMAGSGAGDGNRIYRSPGVIGGKSIGCGQSGALCVICVRKALSYQLTPANAAIAGQCCHCRRLAMSVALDGNCQPDGALAQRWLRGSPPERYSATGMIISVGDL